MIERWEEAKLLEEVWREKSRRWREEEVGREKWERKILQVLVGLYHFVGGKERKQY